MFDCSEYLKGRLKLNIQEFVVGESKCELMALTGEQCEMLESCETYKEMIDFASEHGFSLERQRTIEDEDKAIEVGLMWKHEELEEIENPSFRELVALRVCEISGASDIIDAMRKQEEDRAKAEQDDGTPLKGVNLPDHEVTLGQLEEDAQAHLNRN